MSDLLNSASLVMIPSGYAEDKVYSAVPTDGSGDLSFTRASNGTRINSAGLVEVCPWNLIEYSNTFSNSAWSKNSATVTSGQSGYDGTNNAWKLEATATDPYIYEGSFSILRTQSIYAKAGSTNKFSVIVGGYAIGMQFDLSNGTIVTNSTPSYFSGSITSVGNGWYYIVVTVQATAPTYGFLIAPQLLNGGGISAGDYVYIQNAQVNIGSTAKPYFPTTDRLNVPRLTYQNGGGGCPSLLLEKQSTNYIKYSEDLSQADWNKENAIISTNVTTSPDGTQNADKLIADSVNTDHTIYQSNAVFSGTSLSFSIYAKAGEYNYIFLGSNNNTASDGAFFNLSNGTISQNTSGLTASIQSVGNGWYRCIVSSTNYPTVYGIICLSENGTSLIFAGDSSKGVFVWGAQAELSSYPTSYIPTTSASATRVADFATTNNISSLFGSTEGSFFIEMTYDNTNPSGAIPVFLRSSSNAAYNYATYLQFGGNTVQFYVYNSGSAQLSITSGAIFTTGQKLKIAFAYKNNDFAIYVNGSSIGSSTSGNISSSLAFIDLGTYNQVPDTYRYNGAISEAVLFPTRLTNTQLAQLTA